MNERATLPGRRRTLPDLLKAAKRTGRPLSRPAALCWILLCGAAIFGFSVSDPRVPQPSPPDVVLITIDTLRADRLGCYGYRAVNTPNIDRLATEGVRFDQAIVECPITLPSHASIFTGTYPLYHGVRDNSGYRLSDDHSTLAESLKKQGYRTGAFVGSYVLHSGTGLDQGFDTYDADFETSTQGAPEVAMVERRGGTVMDSALKWLRAARRGAPSFAWIHLYDPHAPYAAPAPFGARYRRSPYDGEVAYTDSVIGRLIHDLTARGKYDTTLISLSSDHGEGLGDHGEATHGLFLYDSTLRVPWILKLPVNRHAGVVIPDQVQGIDVMPTILQFLALPRPDSIQGMGLMSLLEGKRPAKRFALGETFLPRNQYGWSPLVSIRSEEFKYVQAPKPELFDLRKDRGERVNVISSEQGLAQQLRQTRASVATRYSSATAPRARIRMKDAEAFQRLLGLGYIEVGGESGPSIDTESLPDPKDKIEVYDLLWTAVNDKEARRFVQAAESLRRVLASEPKSYLARLLLGMVLLESQELRLAVQELKAAVALRPGELVAHFNLALALARLREDRLAEQTFLKVLEMDPRNDGALNNLGVVYLNQNRHAEAAAIYRTLVSVDPGNSFAWANLGLALLNQKQFTEAVSVLSKAAQLSPKVPQIHNNLGLALMNAGDAKSAAEHYRKAIDLEPSYGQAHFNLALALKQLGRSEEAEREMEIARRLLQFR